MALARGKRRRIGAGIWTEILGEVIRKRLLAKKIVLLHERVLPELLFHVWRRGVGVVLV